MAFNIVDKPFSIAGIEAPVRGNSINSPLRCLPFCSGSAVCRPSGLPCDEYAKFYFLSDGRWQNIGWFPKVSPQRFPKPQQRHSTT